MMFYKLPVIITVLIQTTALSLNAFAVEQISAPRSIETTKAMQMIDDFQVSTMGIYGNQYILADIAGLRKMLNQYAGTGTSEIEIHLGARNSGKNLAPTAIFSSGSNKRNDYYDMAKPCPPCENQLSSNEEIVPRPIEASEAYQMMSDFNSSTNGLFEGQYIVESIVFFRKMLDNYENLGATQVEIHFGARMIDENHFVNTPVFKALSTDIDTYYDEGIKRP